MENKIKYKPKTIKELSNNYWESSCFVNDFLCFINKKYPHLLKEYKEDRLKWEKEIDNSLKKILKRMKKVCEVLNKKLKKNLEDSKRSKK